MAEILLSAVNPGPSVEKPKVRDPLPAYDNGLSQTGRSFAPQTTEASGNCFRIARDMIRIIPTFSYSSLNQQKLSGRSAYGDVPMNPGFSIMDCLRRSDAQSPLTSAKPFNHA